MNHQKRWQDTEYIHLHYANYLARNANSEAQIKNIFLNQQAIIQHKTPTQVNVSETVRADLEDILNYFVNPQGHIYRSDTGDIILTEDKAQELVKRLDKQLSNDQKFQIANYSLGSGSYSQPFFNAMGKCRDSLNSIKKATENFNEDAVVTIQKIEAVVSSIEKYFATGRKKAISGNPEFKQALLQVINIWRDFLKNNAQYNIPKEVQTQCEQSINIGQIASQNYGNFLQALGALINGWYGYGSKQGGGLMEEYLVNAVNYLEYDAINQVYSLIDAELADVKLKKTHTGAIAGYAGTNNITKNFSDEAIRTIRNVTTKQNKAGIAFNTIATQQKVDVNIQFGNESIGTNIKSYSSFISDSPSAAYTGYIGLMSPSHLIDILDKDYIIANHYFNVITQHADSEPNSNIILEAHKTVKMMIMLHALVGGKYRNINGTSGYEQEASLFIVRQKKAGGKHKVYFISEILNRMIQHYFNNPGLQNYQTMITGYDTLDGKQVPLSPSWQSEPWSEYYGEPRMARFLSHIHAASVGVAIPKRLIWDYGFEKGAKFI